MRTPKDKRKKKAKNVIHDAAKGKIGKIYIPDQMVGETPFPDKSKGLKREWKEAKLRNKKEGFGSKKKKVSE